MSKLALIAKKRKAARREEARQVKQPEAVIGPRASLEIRSADDYCKALDRQITHWRATQHPLPPQRSFSNQVTFVVTRLEVWRAMEAIAAQGLPEVRSKLADTMVKWPRPPSYLRPEAKVVSLLLRLKPAGIDNNCLVHATDLQKTWNWPLNCEDGDVLFEVTKPPPPIGGLKQYWGAHAVVSTTSEALKALLGPSGAALWEAKRKRAAETFRLICDVMQITALRHQAVVVCDIEQGRKTDRAAILSRDLLFKTRSVPKQPFDKKVDRSYLALAWQRSTDAEIQIEQIGEALPGWASLIQHTIGLITGQSISKCRGIRGRPKMTDKLQREKAADSYREKNHGKEPPTTSSPLPEAADLEYRTSVLLPLAWLKTAESSIGDGETIRGLLQGVTARLEALRGDPKCDHGHAAVFFVHARDGHFDPEAIGREFTAILTRRKIDGEFPKGRGRGRRLKDWRRNFAKSADPQDWMQNALELVFDVRHG